MVEVKGVLLTNPEQKRNASSGEILTHGLWHGLLNLLPQLKQLAIAYHDVNEEIEVGKLRYSNALRSSAPLPLLEELHDHVFCLQTPIHLILKLAIVDKSAHNLQDKLELVLILPMGRLLALVTVSLLPALEKAGEHLTTPLFGTFALRIQTESKQDGQAFDLGWI